LDASIRSLTSTNPEICFMNVPFVFKPALRQFTFYFLAMNLLPDKDSRIVQLTARERGAAEQFIAADSEQSVFRDWVPHRPTQGSGDNFRNAGH